MSAHTHKGMHVLLYQKFITSGLLEAKYGSFFARLMQLRQKADYNSVFDITQDEGEEILHLSEDFINVITALISNPQP
ncbi:MAG: hypothetical protein LIP02_02620 [Bacteroidales bacterium]|nr:hypothetical protein [Bacteroidales bacterium]